jgi:hypothetical protein
MTHKRGVLGIVFVLAVPLVVAATAFACGNLAALKLDQTKVRPGTEVAAKGRNFNASPNASAVQLRFNGRGGTVLWEGRADANGRFNAAFTAPTTTKGWYVVVATQTGPDGRPAAGTPGRHPLKIRRPAGSASAASPATPWAAPPPGGTAAPSGAPVGLVTGIGMGALALALAAGGFAFARTARRRRVPVARSLS